MCWSTWHCRDELLPQPLDGSISLVVTTTVVSGTRAARLWHVSERLPAAVTECTEYERNGHGGCCARTHTSFRFVAAVDTVNH
jgi:hypothetical protein